MGTHSFLWTILIDYTRGDFPEMLIHHVVTIALIYMQYMSNWIPVGVAVLIIHDIIDVWAYAGKAVVHMKFKPVKVLVYIMCTSSWGYVRLYVFPKAIIWPLFSGAVLRTWACFPRDGCPEGSTIDASFFDSQLPAIKIAVCGLMILYLLHVYWFRLFLVAWHRFITAEFS